MLQSDTARISSEIQYQESNITQPIKHFEQNQFNFNGL